MGPLFTGLAIRLVALYSPFDGITKLCSGLYDLFFDWVLGLVLQLAVVHGSSRVRGWIRLFNRHQPRTEDPGFVLLRGAGEAIYRRQWTAAEDMLEELYLTSGKPCVTMLYYVGGVLLGCAATWLLFTATSLLVLQDGVFEDYVFKLDIALVRSMFIFAESSI